MNTDLHAKIGRETELKLIICSDSPQSLYEEISRLTVIAGYDLSTQATLRLRDRYLDTNEGAYSRKRWALRVRNSESDHFIAMKGPAVTNNYGALDRREIEGKWSRDMLNEIIRETLEIGIELSLSEEAFNKHDPLFTLKGMGLTIIQDRETIRHIRHIAGQKNEPAVEMALDHVKYQVKELTVHHYEIELESKSSLGEKLIPRLYEGLFSLYGNTLRKWMYDKLTLGWVLEKLLDLSDSSECINNCCLTSFAYDRIESMLSQL